MNDSFIHEEIVVGPFQCNCQILVCPKTLATVIIDPGDEAEKILAKVAEIEQRLGSPLKVQHLFHTHAHLDHIGATRAIKESYTSQPDIYLHPDDVELYTQLREQGRLFGFDYNDPLPVDQEFGDQQELRVGEMKFSLIHTPGHSPGSVCLRLSEDSLLGIEEALFSGDTLFQGSIGRTDLWGGNLDQLLKNIKQRLFSLDDDISVVPGHGPKTQVGIEKRSNPFLK